MIVDKDNPSPFMQQWEWEYQDARNNPTMIGSCNRCGTMRVNWGWCPKCHPLHTKELP